jgi:acetoin:2,6-dichlorophenolindophenol oxidoreductase subunit beta
MRELTYIDAVKEAIAEEMRRDPSVIVIGADAEDPHGGSFKSYRGLSTEFGRDRVRGTPLSEASFAGFGVGLAMNGFRPVVDVSFIDFATLVTDQMINHAAKLRYMSGGQVEMPLVLRTQGGGGLSTGAQHGQMLEAWFAHIPGLIVVMPSSPLRGKGLMKSAIRSNDPVVFIGHKTLHFQKGPVPDEGEEVLIPLGTAEIVRPGKDVTLVALSNMVPKALAAATQLAAQGIDVEVIDPRTIMPLDRATVYASVRKTNRLVVAHEAVEHGGFGGEIVSSVVEHCFDYLDAPPVRVAAANLPLPFAPAMEASMLPTEATIVRAVRQVCGEE